MRRNLGTLAGLAIVVSQGSLAALVPPEGHRQVMQSLLDGYLANQRAVRNYRVSCVMTERQTGTSAAPKNLWTGSIVHEFTADFTGPLARREYRARVFPDGGEVLPWTTGRELFDGQFFWQASNQWDEESHESRLSASCAGPRAWQSSRCDTWPMRFLRVPDHWLGGEFDKNLEFFARLGEDGLSVYRGGSKQVREEGSIVTIDAAHFERRLNVVIDRSKGCWGVKMSREDTRAELQASESTELDLKQWGGRFWYPVRGTRIRKERHFSSQTTLEVKDLQINVDFPRDYFTAGAIGISRGVKLRDGVIGRDRVVGSIPRAENPQAIRDRLLKALREDEPVMLREAAFVPSLDPHPPFVEPPRGGFGLRGVLLLGGIGVMLGASARMAVFLVRGLLARRRG